MQALQVVISHDTASLQGLVGAFLLIEIAAQIDSLIGDRKLS
jgi:hypothetical protein